MTKGLLATFPSNGRCHCCQITGPWSTRCPHCNKHQERQEDAYQAHVMSLVRDTLRRRRDSGSSPLAASRKAA